MQDAILRNLWITQGYHDLGVRLSAHLSGEGTWLSYGVWASKTVGVNMRQDELPSLVREAYEDADELRRALDRANRKSLLRRLGIVRFLERETLVGLFVNTLGDVARYLGEGNLKVFAELAPIYGNIIEQLDAGRYLQGEDLQNFIEAQNIDGTPENIRVFQTGIRNYFLAARSTDARERAQRVCYANLLAGLHEQRRLQGAIEKSLDAPVLDGLANIRHLWVFRLLLRVPLIGWLLRKADADYFDLQDRVEQWFQEFITRFVLTINTPDGTYHLGAPLPAPPNAPMYPADLDPITLPDLQALYDRWNQSGPGGENTGSYNWDSLADRMNFILALFRSRQQVPALQLEPFSEEQRRQLVQGKIPTGKL